METPLLLPALVELYVARCRIEGKSPRTVQAYAWTLHRFLAALREEDAPFDPSHVRPEHVIAYLDRGSHLSLESRHRYFREVRCFFSWLVAAGYLESHPFRGLRNVRLPQKIVQPFSSAEIAQVLRACDPTTDAGIRDRALILVLLDTGVRCSECVQLTIAD